MTIQLDLLKSNLQEIYYSTHADQTQISLVANYSGTHIYDSSRGWGRIWRWIYQICSLFTDTDLRLEKLKLAVQSTHQLFLKNAKVASKHVEHYQEYLVKSSKGYSVEEESYFADRQLISEWNGSTLPFVSMVQTQQNEGLTRLFHYCFKEEAENSPQSLFINPESSQLITCQKIIDLEGLLGEILPLATLKKVFKAKLLTSEDHAHLTRFVTQCNSQQIPVRNLHEGIMAIGSQFDKKDSKKPRLTSEAVEVFLEDKGCQVFQTEDDKHLEWKKQLVKDKTLILMQKTYTLSHEIISSVEKTKNSVFALQDNENEVVLVAQNMACLRMRKIREDALVNCPIKSMEIYEIAADGSFAIVEKLRPLQQKGWRQQGVEAVDVSFLSPLVFFLQNMIKENYSLSGINAKTIMVDKNNQLKTLKPLKKELFDFNALENFIADYASDNGQLYEYLVEASGLAQHKVAKYYENVLNRALNKNEIPLDDLAGIFKIGDPKVVDQAKLLVIQALKIKKRLFDLANQPNVNLEKLNEELNKKILSIYKTSKRSSLLQENLFLP